MQNCPTRTFAVRCKQKLGKLGECCKAWLPSLWVLALVHFYHRGCLSTLNDFGLQFAIAAILARFKWTGRTKP